MVGTLRFAHPTKACPDGRSPSLRGAKRRSNPFFLYAARRMLRFARNDVDGHGISISRRDAPELCFQFSPQKSEGAGKAGCWLAPAVSCAIGAEKTHTSIQVSAGASGLPCAMVLRLMPRSPRRRIPLASVIGELAAFARPVGLRKNLRRLDASHGRQDHTPRYDRSLAKARPAISSRATGAAASTAFRAQRP